MPQLINDHFSKYLKTKRRYITYQQINFMKQIEDIIHFKAIACNAVKMPDQGFFGHHIFSIYTSSVQSLLFILTFKGFETYSSLI